MGWLAIMYLDADYLLLKVCTTCYNFMWAIYRHITVTDHVIISLIQHGGRFAAEVGDLRFADKYLRLTTLSAKVRFTNKLHTFSRINFSSVAISQSSHLLVLPILRRNNFCFGHFIRFLAWAVLCRWWVNEVRGTSDGRHWKRVLQDPFPKQSLHYNNHKTLMRNSAQGPRFRNHLRSS